MHECPECGHACDCDQEDTWFEDCESCIHECDEFEDEDLMPDLDELDADGNMAWDDEGAESDQS